MKKITELMDYAIKYEAIVTYENYDKICQMFDADYANPRSLVSGLLGKDDARKYKNFITLVPLKVKTKNLCNSIFYSEVGEFDDKAIEMAYGKDCYYLQRNTKTQSIKPCESNWK